MARLIAAAESQVSSLKSQVPNIDAEIDDLTAALADSLFASWLLGQFQVSSFKSQVAFAEGDEEAGQKPDRKGGRTKSKVQGPKSEDPIETSFDLPPQDAIDYFQSKKIVRKKVFDQLSKESQQAAFSVSRVYKEDVLRGFRDEIDSALRTGATQQQTVKRFKDILSGASHRELGEFHLETIFRTNMQTAYGVGRRRGLQEVSDTFPFWQYHAVMDDRTRPRHAAINGVILPADNPFWDEHYPPWAFNCRCSVTPADSVPDDYDPTHPAGDEDVTVSYDDRGAPAKAEIGTSLIDLQVGNFAGVARGASLLSAVEAGVKRSQESRRQTAGSGSRKK